MPWHDPRSCWNWPRGDTLVRRVEPAAPSLATEFEALRTSAELTAERPQLNRWLTAPPEAPRNRAKGQPEVGDHGINHRDAIVDDEGAEDHEAAIPPPGTSSVGG